MLIEDKSIGVIESSRAIARIDPVLHWHVIGEDLIKSGRMYLSSSEVQRICSEDPPVSWLIKSFRFRRFLSQKDLAVILDCTTKAISEWESGKRTPRKVYLNKLRKLFE